MAEYWIRKQGRVCNLYSMPFTDFNSPPDDFLVNTLIVEDDAELKRQLAGHRIHVVEPAISSAKPKVDVTTPAERIAAIASMDIPEEAKQALLAGTKSSVVVAQPPMQTIDQQLGAVNYAAQLQDKVLQEFRLVLASVGNGYSREEAEAIGNFILSVVPELEHELVKAKLSQGKRRFTL